jgi:hypothetical protein
MACTAGLLELLRLDDFSDGLVPSPYSLPIQTEVGFYLRSSTLGGVASSFWSGLGNLGFGDSINL